MEDTLNLPPFPPLRWGGYSWTAGIVLNAWAGFQSRQGPYASADSAADSDGSVTLNLATPDNQKTLPTPEQAAAFQDLVARQGALRDTVLSAIFAEYPQWQELYRDDFEDAEHLMPDIGRPEQLKTLIGPSTVHLLPAGADGVAPVGFEFGCAWDGEHGLGVMTRSGTVTEVGSGEVGFS